MRKLIILVLILVIFSFACGGVEKYAPSINSVLKKPVILELPSEKVKVVTEESVVINTVKNVGPSVVTVSEIISQQAVSPFDFSPFSFQIPQQNQQAPTPQSIR